MDAKQFGLDILRNTPLVGGVASAAGLTGDPEQDINLARAVLGQGLMMGWGDEAEAWLRSKVGDEAYETALADVQGSYGKYAAEHPYKQAAGELAGAAVPGIMTALGPGTQPAAGAVASSAAGRLASLFGRGTIGRVAATGVGAGGLSAAGTAEEGQKLGAVPGGAILGGGLGLALPIGGRLVGSGYDAVRERVAPSVQTIEDRAGRKLLQFLDQSGLQPKDITQRMAEDQGLGVPSVVANVDPGLVKLAEAVTQRAGAGARKVEDTIGAQLVGQPERVVDQVRKRLGAGDYYNDLDTLVQKTKTLSNDAYAKAYADGELTDPAKLRKFNKFVNDRPQLIAGATAEAKKLFDAGGRGEFSLENPTVEKLDQLKKGIDSLIDGQTDGTTGKVTQLGREYIKAKQQLLEMVDEFSPDYKAARATFGDGKTVEDAYLVGRNDYLKLPDEEAIRLVAKMRPIDKEALRTGVSRAVYDQVMNKARNANSAGNLIVPPASRARLQALFDNPGQYRLFEAALKREAQLHSQAGKILGGSQTAQRQRTGEMLDDNGGGGDLVNLAQGNFGQSISKMVGNLIGGAKLPEKTADRLADLLMSKDPNEVASVVALLERTAKQRGAEQIKAGVRETGATTGLIGSSWPAPLPPDEEP